MAGTSPAMTIWGCGGRPHGNEFPFPRQPGLKGTGYEIAAVRTTSGPSRGRRRDVLFLRYFNGLHIHLSENRKSCYPLYFAPPPRTAPVPEPSRPPQPQRPPRRARIRRATAERRLRIVERLTAGLSVAEIAGAEAVTARRVRQLVAETLAEHAVDTPAGFVPLQICRLGAAMQVAYAKMMTGDLQALDRVVKIVRELDRYHGFGGVEAAPPPAPQVGRPATSEADAEIFRPATD